MRGSRIPKVTSTAVELLTTWIDVSQVNASSEELAAVLMGACLLCSAAFTSKTRSPIDYSGQDAQ